MPYCPHCGHKVEETADFCPNCGASIKPEQPTEAERQAPTPEAPRTRAQMRRERRAQIRTERLERRAERGERRREEKEEEKSEKEEKEEKHEKGEKREKRESTVVGLFAGGFIIFFLGLMFYLEITGQISAAAAWPLWWAVVFVVMILLAVYARALARKRYPKT
jgi:cation transport ATPase